MTKLSSKTKGVFYIILAAFGFSLMSMFIKLAGDLPSFQKAFFRNFIALIFIFIMMFKSHNCESEYVLKFLVFDLFL